VVPALLVIVTAIIVLLPLVPAVPYASPTVTIPSFFTVGGTARISEGQIPADSVVLTYPYVINPDNVGMLWQAVDGMRFKVFGDYAITPGRGGDGTLETPVVQPAFVENLFAYADYGSSFPGLSPAPTEPAPPDPASTALIREFLRRYHVRAVVIDASSRGAHLVASYIEAALGTPPASGGGVLVWYDVSSRLDGLD
jgi:hypothetical protein